MTEDSGLWGGTILRRWLKEGGKPERRTGLESSWRALAFDACARLQSALPTDVELSAPPLFILGPWRSGTTLLHELVASVGTHHAPRSWQCMRPSSFRLLGRPVERQAMRPMDGITVSTNSTQEDEFAILLSGAPSLYRGFLDPRRLGELAPLLYGSDGNEWEPALIPFLRGVAAETPKIPLILKSPNHLFRFHSIRRRFPQSACLLMLRDPVETWLSNFRMWTTMAQRHGLWAAPEGEIAKFVSAAIRASAARMHDLHRLQSEGLRLAPVRLNALVISPAETTLSALAAIGEQPDIEMRQLVDRAHVPAYKSRTAGELPSPEAKEAVQLLAEAQALFSAAA